MFLTFFLPTRSAPTGNLKEFKEVADKDPEITGKIQELRGRVEEFATKFPMPGK